MASATQEEFKHLDRLELAVHGDSLERFYWESVATAIPTYETFWRSFIVLLTNRVNTVATDDWIRVRRGIPEKYERLLMGNYTVFYDIAVAWAQIEAGKRALADGGFYHAEPFFFYARACIENLDKNLLARARPMLRGAGITERIPGIPDGVMRETKIYRDTYMHKPVLGRGSKFGRDLVLKPAFLPQSKNEEVLTWTNSEKLSNAMTDIIELQTRQWTTLATYLKETWGALATAFEDFRVTDDFIQSAGLAAFLPIPSSIGVLPSFHNPLAVSGKQIFKQE
jgi:hypothetical protein